VEAFAAARVIDKLELERFGASGRAMLYEDTNPLRSATFREV
jgi:hypothetical protein